MKYVVTMMDSSTVEINESEKTSLENAMFKSTRFVKIGEQIINTSSISSIMSKVRVQIRDAYKNGEWVCDYGFRHQKGEHCACSYHARLGTTPNADYLIEGVDGRLPTIRNGFIDMKELIENKRKELDLPKQALNNSK